MANFKMYRVVTATPTTPHNLVLGTTSTVRTFPLSADDKGAELVVQNLSTGATDIYVFHSSTGAINIGATSTSGGSGGIKVAQNGLFQISGWAGSQAIQTHDVWVASTSSMGICQAMLVKAV